MFLARRFEPCCGELVRGTADCGSLKEMERSSGRIRKGEDADTTAGWEDEAFNIAGNLIIFIIVVQFLQENENVERVIVVITIVIMIMNISCYFPLLPMGGPVLVAGGP